MSDEMPNTIWVEKNIHGWYDGFAEKQHVPLKQFTNTDWLRSQIEGMRVQGSAKDGYWAGAIFGKNTTIDQVLNLLETGEK